MKLDGKQPYQQDLAHEVASKVVKPNGSHLLIDLFKVEDENLWEWKDDHSSSVEKQYGQPAKPFELSYVEVGHPIDGKTIIEQSTVQTSKAGLIVKEKDLSVDKIVTEITLPTNIDALDCCAGNVVKDICIDEGAQAVEMILVESEEQIVSSSINDSLNSGNDYIKKEMMDSSTSFAHDDLKSRSLSGSLACISDKNTKERYDGSRASTTEIADGICNTEISVKQVFPEDLAANSQLVCPMSSSCSSDWEQSVDRQTIDQGTAKDCYVIETVVSDICKLNVTQTKENPADGNSKGVLEEYSATTAASPDTSDGNQWNEKKACNTQLSLSEGIQEEDLSSALSAPSEATESNDDVWNVGNSNTSVNGLLEDGSIAVTTRCLNAPVFNQNSGTEETPTDSLSSSIPEERRSSVIDVLSDAAEYNHGNLDNLGNREICNGTGLCNFNPQAEDTGETEMSKESTHDQQAVHDILGNPGSCGKDNKASIGDSDPRAEDTGGTEMRNDTDGQQPDCCNLENSDSCEKNNEVSLCNFNLRAADTGGTEVSEAKDSHPAERGNLQNPGNYEIDNEVSSAYDFKPTAEHTANKEAKNSQQPHHTQEDPVVEATVPDSVTALARSSVHRNHMDLTLYGPSISSGSVATSGHLPYSGSISIRSDSSTTSTRSFAFPILPSEWNSSPVKMAKPDRRRYRKHRGWRNGLLCCRF